MEELKIQLTYNPQNFRDIYYRNGHGNVFTYKPTQKAIILFLFCVLLVCITYFILYTLPSINWLLLFAFISLFFAVINAGIVVTKYLRWKAGVEAFIKGFAQYKSFYIHLTSGGIEFTQDSTITIDKWNIITSAQFFENYIIVYKENEASYFIPAKSMKPDEFIMLKDFIATKIKVTK